MSSRNSNLKNCPLCGNEASYTKLEEVYNISCGVSDDGSDSCGLVLFGGSDIGLWEMMAKWNSRINTREGEDE